VIREDSLSAVLNDFARTLATDFPIQKILDHLVERIVSILPISSAGVTLIPDGVSPQYIAASNDDALGFEQLQSELRQGPCLQAYNSGQAVAVSDLRTDGRFPEFAEAALSAGLAAVFTFPRREVGGRLGALDLYRKSPGALDAEDLEAAQTLADVTAAYLHNAYARDDARAASELFEHSALHDPLTDLPNRLLLQQRLEHATQRAQRSHANAAVLFVDLDDFKKVNDTHGHQVGDDLLVGVASRLASLVRPGDTLARWAGDEFVFLCEDLRSELDVEALAIRVGQAFVEPFSMPGFAVTVSASIGVAFAGPGQHISDRLLAEADVAMYQAKRKGGAGYEILDLRDALHAVDRNSLASDLRAAFAAKNLRVVYQPIVPTADGKTTGVEALLRWTDPRRGVVAPTAIVAVCEQSELINQIGAWVLERACRDRADWLQQHPEAPLEMAVNVSARQLMSGDFADFVADMLSSTGMDPAALVLEMTEYILLEDSEQALRVLAALRALGVRIALDDFGTGFSSLNYLRRLPISIVKIDQGFIADIDHAPEGAAIAAAVTNLAHVLDLDVTAEGVETHAQHEAVKAMGCDFAQGYFYARRQTSSRIASARAGVGAPCPPGPIALDLDESSARTKPALTGIRGHAG
jgi:diguanylate cyclase (GGDEF)-like protein